MKANKIKIGPAGSSGLGNLEGLNEIKKNNLDAMEVEFTYGVRMKNDKAKFKKNFKKRLYKFTLRLVKFLGTLDTRDPVTRVIIDQLARSGTSVLANYIEGLSASSKKDFTNYFNNSLKSANESKVWLALLRDSGKCEAKDVKWMLSELDEISNIFGSSILKLRGIN